MGTITYGRNASLIVPIVTTRACKAKFYWNGPNSDIKVYAPTITTLENVYGITRLQDAYASYTYARGTTSFPIDLNIPGTWYVVVVHNILYLD